MAEDQVGVHRDPQRYGGLWTKLFGTFKVALDPKKLLLAAAGIVVMALGWIVLSFLFWAARSEPEKEKDYPVADYMPTDTSLSEKERRAKAEEDSQKAFDAAERKYRLLQQTAGPGGSMRTLPWSEDRGPNPFLVLKDAVAAASPEGAVRRSGVGDWLDRKQFLVLIEPLLKFLTPVVYLFHPDAGFWNRVYFLLVILWTLATWALFGAAITRMAAVQFARNDKIGMMESVRFAWSKYLSFFMAPVVPLAIVAGLAVFLIVFGFVAAATWAFGDIIIAGLFWPLVILFGLVMALLLVGLVGWPLMYSTISTEGSDSFDALSRSYSYVYQAPWHYLWYGFIAVIYGAALVFFVGLIGSLTVYLGKWAVGQAPFASKMDREPDYLFVYAPQSFQWRELLLQGSPVVYRREEFDAAVKEYEQRNLQNLGKQLSDGKITLEQHEERKKTAHQEAQREIGKTIWPGKINLEARDKYTGEMAPWNKIGAGLVAFWLILVLLLVVGFGYSYFWSASVIIYLLMRKKVDDTDLDEVHLDEEDREEPYTPPVPAATPGAPAKPAGSPNLIAPESLTMRPAAAAVGSEAGPASSKEPTSQPPKPSGGEGGPPSGSPPAAEGRKINGPTEPGGGS
jgi:hypothetical protein